MTAQLPATQPKPQIAAGGQVGAIVPQSLDEVFRVSQAIAASGLAPAALAKPEQIMVAIMAGAELGLAPFQSLQSFAVVNGRPTLWGDGLIAVVRARGVRVKEWIDGEGDAMVAHCICTRPDTGEEVERAFTVAQAKKAGLWGKTGPWTQYPQRMLQMRARALSLRDGCADMLRGIQVREEVEDYQPIRDITPQKSGLRDRLSGSGKSDGFSQDNVTSELDAALDGDRLPDHDAHSGEVIEPSAETVATSPAAGGDEQGAAAAVTPPPAQDDEFPGDKPTLADRSAAFRDAMAKATKASELRVLRKRVDPLFDDLERYDPEGRVELAFAYEKRLDELVDAERGQ